MWRIRFNPAPGWLAAAMLAASAFPVLATETGETGPTTDAVAAPRPSEATQYAKPRTPPRLDAASAKSFVDFAAASTSDEKEAVRTVLLRAASQAERIVPALCAEAKAASEQDPQRSLIALALIGELRHAAGVSCLREVLERPLPTSGTLVDGEILESLALEMQQAKAVAGLAYLKRKETDEEVLKIAGSHPSRIVRAEAIAAFLWNQRDSRAARERLARAVRPEERIFIDRVTRIAGEKGDAFNARLDAFLKAHPEAIAPAPEKLPVSPRKDDAQPGEPPRY